MILLGKIFKQNNGLNWLLFLEFCEQVVNSYMTEITLSAEINDSDKEILRDIYSFPKIIEFNENYLKMKCII